MGKTNSVIHNIITSDFPPITDSETLRRVKLINVSSIIGLVFIVVFSASKYFDNQMQNIYALILMSCAIVINFIILRYTKNSRLVSVLVSFITFIYFQYHLFYGMSDRVPYVWSYLVPLFSALLLGMRNGLIWTGVFWIVSALGMIIPLDLFNANQYSALVIVRHLSAYFIISLVTFYSEYSRMKAVDDLRFNERRYSMLLSKGASVYAVLAGDGSVLYESPSLKEVYGYEPSELEGTNIFDLVHPDDVERSVQELTKLFEDPKTPQLIEVRYKHKDGTYRDIEVVGLNLLDDPAIRGIILTSHDISRVKDAERKIRLLNENLELRISERTEELRQSEERFRQSEKMRAIGQLAGGIAHDFNNQLTGILGCADLIRIYSDRDSKIYKYADTIVSTTRKAADLTRQLLAFARKGKYQSVITNIHPIINEVITLLKHTVDKKITIGKELQYESACCVVDPAQLHNALLNLAINARDAMPDGGEITFSTRTIVLDDEFCRKDQFPVEPGPFVLVEVKDTGSGIAEDILGQIFEPFFTTKEIGGGTGMGLAAVYGTVESHGGTINVRSTVGLGSIFELYLPLSKTENRELEQIEENPDERRESAHVLIIDDEEAVCLIISEILKRAGHRVTIHTSGSTALEYYKDSREDIDLVILDMIMPGIDGSELFVQIRELNPYARVILSSGYSVDSNIEQLLSSGAVSFIQKPYSIGKLTRKINSALQYKNNKN